MIRADILVAGAGPAGIAASVRAAESGRQVTLVDDNPAEGGQIWRGGKKHPADRQSSLWFERLQRSGAKVLTGTRIVGGDARHRTLQVETPRDAFSIQYRKLILATGARELFLPFPGWTLPNVTGVGGLQALVKGGLPVEGKRIVVAGSGPLLLAVAAFLRKRGATVPVICEQANRTRLARFGIDLARHPAKLWKAAVLKASLGATHYLSGSWVTSAQGTEKISRVVIRSGGNTRSINCDYLAIAYGFVPNAELPEFLGCCVRENFAVVDDFQSSSLDGIYCAGELTGLGGADLSLVEGEIAGYAAAGRQDLARNLFASRDRSRQFARSLNRAFVLREELRALQNPETIVCRCEDVSFEKLQMADSWRAAKLYFRCGMGPCQGRICGPAVEFLLGWKPESVRPPVFPIRVASMISNSLDAEEG